MKEVKEVMKLMVMEVVLLLLHNLLKVELELLIMGFFREKLKEKSWLCVKIKNLY